MEMRDRSGFDAHGRDESDRGDLDLRPGHAARLHRREPRLRQRRHRRPAGPEPARLPARAGLGRSPNLDDAAFTAAAGDSHFSDSGEGHVDNYSDPSRDDGLWRFDFDCLTLRRRPDGGPGRGAEARNLVGRRDVRDAARAAARSTTARRDAAGGGANGAPTARAQARPATAKTGETVRFDGSGSFDDRDAPEKLAYAWDFDGDGTEDATGREAAHAYDRAGGYDAKLTVTDSGGRRPPPPSRDRRGLRRSGGSGGPAGPAGPGRVRRPGSGVGPGPGGHGRRQGRLVRLRDGQRLPLAAGHAAGRRAALRVRPPPARRRGGRRLPRRHRAPRRPRSSASRASAAARARSRWRGRRRGERHVLHARRAALGGRRLDVRRAAFERRGGAFATRAGRSRAATAAGAIRAFKLERPGVRRPDPRRCRCPFRLARTRPRGGRRAARGKVVKRVSRRMRTGLRTYRLRVSARGLARGEYRIRLRAGSAKATLGARRL